MTTASAPVPPVVAVPVGTLRCEQCRVSIALDRSAGSTPVEKAACFQVEHEGHPVVWASARR